jgi:hypothetical protein
MSQSQNVKELGFKLRKHGCFLDVFALMELTCPGLVSLWEGMLGPKLRSFGSRLSQLPCMLSYKLGWDSSYGAQSYFAICHFGYIVSAVPTTYAFLEVHLTSHTS